MCKTKTVVGYMCLLKTKVGNQSTSICNTVCVLVFKCWFNEQRVYEPLRVSGWCCDDGAEYEQA
jgi:hypothetical protein